MMASRSPSETSPRRRPSHGPNSRDQIPAPAQSPPPPLDRRTSPVPPRAPATHAARCDRCIPQRPSGSRGPAPHPDAAAAPPSPIHPACTQSHRSSYPRTPHEDRPPAAPPSPHSRAARNPARAASAASYIQTHVGNPSPPAPAPAWLHSPATLRPASSRPAARQASPSRVPRSNPHRRGLVRVRRIHLLAEHVLHKLSYAGPSQMARTSCPSSGEESVDADAESGWRLAA